MHRFEVEYLKNGASYGQRYYRTVIGNHCRMVSLSMTLIDPHWHFKVAIFFDIEYLRNDTR